jgi:tRNA nucleotidyltransferase/poly(A) polymerase
MPARILPRSEHTVSRKNIDSDALKVLYRLKHQNLTAYLVGGGVRDLLLGRKPKDFDISTSAHPQQVKRLFRNCFIVGRRFRLCHVRFGRKVIEVSTFRKQAESTAEDPLIQRDNTFGTPEEDAFRRDFTVNAMFYDIATFSVIDYVGGLEDLDARSIRSIGDPGVRLREDPVRMLRAVALAARLGFTIERDTLEAIRALRGEIVRSSAARVLEEIYKLLRQGAARATFQMLHDVGLLAYMLPEADRALSQGGEKLLGGLARLDDYRNAGSVPPEDLSNALLLGTLLVPLDVPLRRAAVHNAPEFEDQRSDEPVDLAAELLALGTEADEPELAPAPMQTSPLALPFARRDVDRLRVILLAQDKLREIHRSPRIKHLLASRVYFADALRWMEIHGGIEEQELVAYWRGLDFSDVPPAAPVVAAAAGTAVEPEPGPEEAPAPGDRPRRRRRRRRKGGRRSEPPASPPAAEGGGEA